jgi:uncharacterized protein YecE (DUF72 family)
VTVVVGTSGWHYGEWRPLFYPAGMGPARWLSFYAERFATVEVNNAFYRLPERDTFVHWRDSVPSDFVFAVKASRYLTHVKRLEDPAEPVARLMERVSGLGSRLGPILLQLPPNLPADPDRLDAALAAFKGEARLVVEPRHTSWFVDDVRAVLEHRGAALCVADGGPVETPIWHTTDWGYVRFHRGHGRPPSCYTRHEMETWSRRLAEQWDAAHDVYCYFNNDSHGCALRDASWLADACARAGRQVTRVAGLRRLPHGVRRSM